MFFFSSKQNKSKIPSFLFHDMFRHLTSLRDQLLLQLQHSRPLPRITELHNILVHLADNEKQYLRKTFLKTSWNIGSTIVLAQLQLASILTMTDYIWMQYKVPVPSMMDSQSSFMMIDSEEMEKQTGESVQLILNDLLETQFVLLADLMRNIGRSDLKVFDVLRECFKRLIGDLSANPEMVQINCLRELRKYLNFQEMSAVRSMMWGVFEDLESSSVIEAIEKQASWSQEFTQTASGTLEAIMREVASDEVQFLGNLLAMLRSPDTFTGWYWWLRFYGFIISNESLSDEVFLNIRQQLKELFRQYQLSHSDTLFYAMMLCARQTCRFASTVGGISRFESYAKWYKNTIGEMQYGQTKEEFRRTMQTMSRMIKHEGDMEVLEVHAKTSIAAPAFCGDLVLSFKQVSKSWLEDLRAGRNEDICVMVID